MTVAKNQTVTLAITGMTAEGSGVGHIQNEDGTAGLAVFVPKTAIGDEIDCRIVKAEKRFAYGMVERLITSSPDRAENPGCPVYGKCGGCVYRHVTYAAECRYKRQRVADAFARVGNLPVEVDEIVPSDKIEHYRNKAQFPVAGTSDKPPIGFFAPRSHRVIEAAGCPLQPKAFSETVEAVRAWIKEAGVPPYDEQTKSGLLRHIYLRENAKGEQLLCLVCTSGKLPAVPRLLERLHAIPAVKSVCVNINKQDTNVILGETTFPLLGDPWIEDTLCGMTFRLSPLSFYQVNHDQAERLYALAKDAAALTKDDVLLDLYCGTGTIGLTMARDVRELIGVEIVPQAVEDAKKNAAQNGALNARFLCADAAKAAKQLEKEGLTPTVVVVDPPRKGCDESLIDTIVTMAPSRVVYVSCDPATLARDCARFAEKGYEVKKVTPVDMFPRTKHVETVVLMIRA
ncbi:MAG: 23S rRNA (uracil(1939)-C(5))-methyltransferase RlmD [Clostridia bacterium]|nr:23S rRNA (uracil(1939)-C(5))-methyltransferase RlmD [Clostridia bacterium]